MDPQDHDQSIRDAFGDASRLVSNLCTLIVVGVVGVFAIWLLWTIRQEIINATARLIVSALSTVKAFASQSFIRVPLASFLAFATLALGTSVGVMNIDHSVKDRRRFWSLSPKRIEAYLASLTSAANPKRRKII